MEMSSLARTLPKTLVMWSISTRMAACAVILRRLIYNKTGRRQRSFCIIFQWVYCCKLLYHIFLRVMESHDGSYQRGITRISEIRYVWSHCFGNEPNTGRSHTRQTALFWRQLA